MQDNPYIMNVTGESDKGNRSPGMKHIRPFILPGTEHRLIANGRADVCRQKKNGNMLPAADYTVNAIICTAEGWNSTAWDGMPETRKANRIRSA